MQISNIKIENFKGIEKYSLEDVKKCVAIVGSNGKGKSTILEAIRAILTGNIPSTPIRSGTDKAVISADVCGFNIERRIASKNSVRFDGKATTQKSVAQFLEEKTNVTGETMEIATSANILSAMSAGNLSNYLVTNGLIPAVITINDLLSLCSVSKDAETRLRSLLPPSPHTFTMDTIEELYNKLYGERTNIKQNIKAYKLASAYEGDAPQRSLEEVEKDLQRFVVYDNECETYNKLLRIYNDSAENRKKALERLAEVERKIKDLPNVTVDESELKFLNDQKNKAQDELIAAKETEATLKANISIFERTLESLNSTVCPISERLVCSTDKTAAREEITGLLDKNRSEFEKISESILKLNERITSLNDKIKKYHEREAVQREMSLLYDRRKNIKENIPSVPDAPVKPVEIEDANEEKANLSSLVVHSMHSLYLRNFSKNKQQPTKPLSCRGALQLNMNYCYERHYSVVWK